MKTKMRVMVAVGSGVIMVLAIVLAVTVSGQRVRGERENRESREPAAGGPWEYLVVAGGNVNLSSLSSEEFSALRKQPDGSFNRENSVLERNLDKLGARGWELVAVYGAPNDPVYYFKRPKEVK